MPAAGVICSQAHANAMETVGDLIQKRQEKNDALKRRGVNLYPNDFTVADTIEGIQALLRTAPQTLTEQGPYFMIAGRLMAVNHFGKAAFVRLRDRTGMLQAYIRRDRIGEEAFALFKQLDVGDFVGLKGTMFQTRTGEWTLLAQTLNLLAKAVRPLPEKFHGLRDPEKRYRQRYIDLVMNPDVREIFIRRSRMIQAIRTFFLERGFLEVETPMMQVIPGGAEATPFKTHHNALGMDLYLRIAPELYLKRLVVGGFERVFEINRNFRNEGVSTQHNPEFTMLEFYQAYATYSDLMDLTEKLLACTAEKITGSLKITYQGQEIDFSGGWQRLGLFDALESIAGMERGMLQDRQRLLEFAAGRNITITKTGKLAKIILKLFDVLVQPHLIQPTFITGYPAEVSPLSRRSDHSPDLTERFELFIGGREIANGFSELNDPADQRERFLQQVKEREAGDAEAHWMDEDYIEALEYGMPPTAGEGIGIDRLAMLLTDSPSIREVILFPHMKPRE
jgi:lysyl-tRNA synthetase class 2